MLRNKRIIVGPLNWGLGHATRCIPIIRQLLKQGNTIAIATDGLPMELLKNEFPTLPFFELPPYNISYPYQSAFLNIVSQSSKILRTYFQEIKATKTIVDSWQPDILLSDNRFGFRNGQTRNIFITHQLNIAGPNAFVVKLGTRVHEWFYTKFNEIWVPDHLGADSLAGKLSQKQLKMPVNYIGPQSRMLRYEIDNRFDYIAILSGPEPQRTRLESMVVDLFSQHSDLNFCLVRGTNTSHTIPLVPNIELHDVVSTKKLNELINESGVVISRSGYTSIMDYSAMDKRAIMVPTPGQPEQEYLAQHLAQNHLFKFIAQNNFNTLDLSSS